MAQLYFYYSAMNAGKSTSLLQSAYNYREQNMSVVLFTAALDNRFGEGKIASRIGLQSDAYLFDQDFDLEDKINTLLQSQKVDCIFIDEAQFLTKNQVKQLTNIVDELNIPVLAYGLRTDFLGDTFSGSRYLLAWADKIIELKTICHCGRKANFVVRLDPQGNAVSEGEQIEVGGNDKYQSMCRQHFKQYVWS
ncbi:thymidine kinase [Alteromonadaceae bacterium BrNp21-10]|nr:thymidine kinase [Alteromonadaceae bacterium BrNp21-10]